MKSMRRSLDKDRVRDSSQIICENLFGLSAFSESRNICIYMSSFNEVDTDGIIKRCSALGKNVFVPCVRGDDIFISAYSDDMVTASFGIREPENAVPADKDEIDLFIVPALAFDRRGARVGFGRGYYDRLLSGTDAVKIGLLYDFQLLERIETQAHDIYMDYLIYEGGVIFCESQIQRT